MKFFMLGLALSALSTLRAGELRIGLIGCDTSHATEFTRLLNDTADPQHVPGARVVAAVKAWSTDIPDSASLVDGYEKMLREKWGVKFLTSAEELCKEVDAVMIESVDGRPHLEQARPVFAARKPVFIDKPIAGSLKDAVEIYKLSKSSSVPCFTGSAYRYYDTMIELQKADAGKVRGAVSWGPGPKEAHHPDLFWYGIHPTEALYTVLGAGCETVSRSAADGADVVTGLWKDGRSGTLIALRNGATPQKVVLFGDKAVVEQKPTTHSYAPLVTQIVTFFETGMAPVPLEETVEMFAFMEAADESKRQGGAPVKVADVLKKAGWEPR